MRFSKIGTFLAIAIVAVALLGSARSAFAANGQIAAGQTFDVPANTTVSGDIEIANGGQRFYDGRGTPTVVFFAQPATILARWGASWVSLDETRPETVAARNNATLQVYPTGAQVPATLAGTIGNQPPVQPVAVPVTVPVVVPVAQPAPAQANASTCPPFRPGALSPQAVLQKAANADGYVVVCGSIISVPGVLYGPDYVLPSSNKPVDVPAGYVVDADAVVHGVAQYTGGEVGESMAVMNLFPRGGRLIAGYGGNMFPGGIDAFATAIKRCQAKFAEGSKALCAIVDPEPEADQQ